MITDFNMPEFSEVTQGKLDRVTILCVYITCMYMRIRVKTRDWCWYEYEKRNSVDIYLYELAWVSGDTHTDTHTGVKVWYEYKKRKKNKPKLVCKYLVWVSRDTHTDTHTGKNTVYINKT